MTQEEYLDRFVQGFCEALLWANTYQEPITGSEEPKSVDPAWWQAPGSLWALEAFDSAAQAEILSDCESFVTSQWNDLSDMDPAQAGHDFLLTRSGHGAGFWDRGLGERGDRLTDASKPYGDIIAWCHREDDPDSDNLCHLF